jgi:hypothetical protein
VVGRRQRDDHLAHAVAPRPRAEVVDRPQHAHVAQQPTLLGRVVVEQAHHAPLPASREVLGQPRAGLAGAGDEHRLAEGRERAVQPMLLPDAVREARAGHQEDQHDRIEHQHAARHDRLQLQHDEADRDQHRAEPRREHDALQVEQAREAPQPAVEAEREEDRRLHGDDPREREEQVDRHRLAHVEVHAQPVHPHPGERRGAHVVREGEPGTPVRSLGHRVAEGRRRQ